ncbi:MAG TPA: helix-turn-helix domain-containing protein [Chloroflexia bacterium]|nr:helix-turn-helix domain-containing protein [Chloroflexia bacterium]
MPNNSKELSRSRTAPPERGPASRQSSKAPPASAQAQAGKLGSSFAARFGRVILQHGVAAIPSALYHFQGKLGLTAQQVWFVSYILAHKWADALPHPSLNKMARCTGVDRRVLQYRCAELTNLGLMQIYPRYGEQGDQNTNYFDFSGLFEQLEAILLEEPAVPNPIRDVEGRPGYSNAAQLEARETLSGTVTAPSLTEAVELDFSFLARYGRVLLRYGIATVPKAIFTYQAALGLTPQQVWFVCYILSFQWDTSLPYPSMNKMAERTGYSKRQLLRIKDELVASDYLEVVRRTSSDRGNDTNAYDFSLLLEAIRRELQTPEGRHTPSEPDTASKLDEIEGDTTDAAEVDGMDEQITYQPAPHRRARPPQPRGRNVATVDIAAASYASMPTKPVERHVTREVEHNVTNPIERHVITQVEQRVIAPVAQEVTGEIVQGVTSQMTRTARSAWQRKSPGGRKLESPKIEVIQLEVLHEDDSNQRSQKNGSMTKDPKASALGHSPYIAAIASDFSRELGDALHEASNMKQALNLWRDSGLNEQHFVELMQEARKLTRKYQSRPSWDAMNNKMAYLFATLRDLVAQAIGGY